MFLWFYQGMTLRIRDYDLGSHDDHLRLREAVEGLHHAAAVLDPLDRLRMAPGYVDYEVTERLQALRRQQGTIYIAEVDGDFAGLAIGMLSGQSDIDRLAVVASKIGVISDLFVCMGYRGNGVGTALLEHVERYLLGLGCNTLWLSTNAFNAEACKFYEQRGYTAREVAFMKLA